MRKVSSTTKSTGSNQDFYTQKYSIRFEPNIFQRFTFIHYNPNLSINLYIKPTIYIQIHSIPFIYRIFRRGLLYYIRENGRIEFFNYYC
jgi:hypothetical protein